MEADPATTPEPSSLAAIAEASERGSDCSPSSDGSPRWGAVSKSGGEAASPTSLVRASSWEARLKSEGDTPSTASLLSSTRTPFSRTVTTPSDAPSDAQPTRRLNFTSPGGSPPPGGPNLAQPFAPRVSKIQIALLAFVVGRAADSSAALVLAALLLIPAILLILRQLDMAAAPPFTYSKAAAEFASHRAAVMSELQARLADPSCSDTAILVAGADAIDALCPDGAIVGAVLAAFTRGKCADAVREVSCLELRYSHAAAEAALLASMEASAALPHLHDTSIALACGPESTPIDSAQLQDGLRSPACADWRAAADAGLRGIAPRAITTPLRAGSSLSVGFSTLYLSAAACSLPDSQPHWRAALLNACDAIGEVLYVRRALAVSTTAATACAADAGLQSQPWRADADATLRALRALDDSAAADGEMLSAWTFDPFAVAESEMPRLFVAMLHGQGLLRAFRIEPEAAYAFANAVALHMTSFPARQPYHNTRHVFAVASLAFKIVDAVPADAACFDTLDALALLLAAMVHDLEHSGETNSFHVATQSEMARRFNDVSVLENHSLTIAFQLFAQTGLLAQLTPTQAVALRRRLIYSVLYTDMARHTELLAAVDAKMEVLGAERSSHSSAGVSAGTSRSSSASLERQHEGVSESWLPEPEDSGGPADEGCARSGETAEWAAAAQPQLLAFRRSSTRHSFSAAQSAAEESQPLSFRRSSTRQSFSTAPPQAEASPPHSPSARRSVRWSLPALGQPAAADPKAALDAFFGDAEADRLLLIAFLLHAADLGNSFFPASTAQRAANALRREFAAQAAAERRLRLPVTVPEPESDGEQARSELRFIQLVSEPMARRLLRLLPSLAPAAAMLAENRARWAALGGL